MKQHKNKHEEDAKVTKKSQRRSARLAIKKANAEHDVAILVTSSEGESMVEPAGICMRLASALPAQFGINTDIPIPVIVLFDHVDGMVSDIGDLWAFVSLIEETVPNPPCEDLLSGQRADSVHQLCAQSAELHNTFGYASFPHLRISEPGRFRLRITAIDMKSSESAGRVLPILTSDAFEVVEASGVAVSEMPMSNVLFQLKELGIIDQ